MVISTVDLWFFVTDLGIPLQDMEARSDGSEDHQWSIEARTIVLGRLLNDEHRVKIEQLFREGLKIKDIRQKMIGDHNLKAS